MNILITGAAGGIGSTLGYNLFKAGHNLTLVDSLRNGYQDNLLINGEEYGEFYKLDILETKALSEIIKLKNISVIIHLAAITALPDCETNKAECIRINVEGTVSVMEAARENNVKKIIFSSTSAIYENNPLSESPYNESLVSSPSLFYSLSKKMAEDVCNSYVKNYGMNIQVLRFFNVIGPRQDLYRKSPPLINYLVKCYLNNKEPILHSDGNQLRDYIHVDDVVELIKTLIIKNSYNETLNVCSGKLLSLNEIVKYVSDEFKNKKSPKYRDASMLWDSYTKLFDGKYSLDKAVVAKEVKKYCLGSNLKAKSLGWQPNDDMEHVIKSTVKEIIKKYN